MDQEAEAARQARAAARSSWPIRRFRLGEEPSDDLSATTTAQQRLEMMWPLAVEAWSLTGRPIPDYSRDQTPYRLFRPGEPRDSD
jgi:hypothetical protein